MEEIAVRNPRTGAVDYHITPPSSADIQRTCAELRAAQPAFAAMTIAERGAVLKRWADEIEAASEEITTALALDTGRWRLSVESPLGLVGSLRSWAESAPGIIQQQSGTSSVNPAVQFQSQYKPYPLLGVISPWNFPLILSLIDAIPALMAGCAAIIKPSEVTPRFIEPLRKTIARVPELERVLRYVTGDGRSGQDIISNVDIICFTGSVATGRKVGEAAAQRFIPAFLELGGKDPVIVTEDADLDRAARAVLRGCVFATGQICYSIERVYVHESIHDALVGRLVSEAEALAINYPDIHAGHIGPLIFARQGDIIKDHIDDAVAKGAKVLTGGTVEEHDGGLWVRPTVLTGCNHDMKVMTQETFGPLIPVMSFKDEAEAINLANDTTFGLSAAVIAGDRARGEQIAQQIDAGAVSVMDTLLTGAIIRDAEKTSFKFSGLGGTRMGPGSIMRFFRKKAILTNTGEAPAMQEMGEKVA
jgi:acyl-CoA reductase-like NAD-dependent aldehyde dehydrogenase